MAGVWLVLAVAWMPHQASAQCAITTCVVTSSADTINGNADPTLRDAIIFANANPGTSITFSNGIAGSTITLTNELPLILGNNTSIDGGAQNITVSGNNTVRVFFVGNTTAAVAATIENLTISDATTTGGSASAASGGNGGGGGGLGRDLCQHQRHAVSQ